MIPTYTFQCHTRRCGEEYESYIPLNQTIWCMEDDGWQIEGGFPPTKVLCPLHTKVVPGEVWLVECRECDYDEEFNDPDEAEEEAAEHNDMDCCDYHFHDARVLNPEEQKERKEKQHRFYKEQAERKAERDVHERYVAFLIWQDEQRKRHMETGETRQARQNKLALGLFVTLMLAAAIIIVIVKGN